MHRSLIESSGSGTSIVRRSRRMLPMTFCGYSGPFGRFRFWNFSELELKNIFWRSYWTVNYNCRALWHHPKMHQTPWELISNNSHSNLYFCRWWSRWDPFTGPWRRKKCWLLQMGTRFGMGYSIFLCNVLKPTTCSEMRLKVQLMGKWFQKNKTQLEGLTAWYWDCDHCFRWFLSLQFVIESCDSQDEKKQKCHNICTTTLIAVLSCSTTQITHSGWCRYTVSLIVWLEVTTSIIGWAFSLPFLLLPC